mgnify:CR=1 FL=1|jgi:hypothetical protein
MAAIRDNGNVWVGRLRDRGDQKISFFNQRASSLLMCNVTIAGYPCVLFSDHNNGRVTIYNNILYTFQPDSLSRLYLNLPAIHFWPTKLSWKLPQLLVV